MDLETITITTAKPDDCKTLAKLSSGNLQDFWTHQHFEDEQQNPFSKTLVALQNNTPVGYLVGHIAENGIIQSFAVSKPYQHKGVGSRLLEYFLNDCKRAGVQTVTLDVRISNKQATSFYAKKGFQIAHTAKNFYTKPTEDAHLLVLKLQH